jgi:hypothetical protein
MSSSVSKNINLEVYRTIILPVVLYGCETWSLTLREEHRSEVFENKVTREIIGPTRNGENYIMRSLTLIPLMWRIW